MKRTHLRAGFAMVLAVVVAFSVAAVIEAQNELLSNTTVINFGPINSTAAPMTPPLHVVVPDSATIGKGETVTFMINGGGHGVAIYPVSNHTTRADILEGLCNPHGLACADATAQRAYLVTDGKGDVIVNIAADPIPPGPTHAPVFDYQPGRVFGAMGGVPGPFLNGAVGLATPPAQGLRLQHRFDKTGRFLVICMNRVHAARDHMFALIDVVGPK